MHAPVSSSSSESIGHGECPASPAGAQRFSTHSSPDGHFSSSLHLIQFVFVPPAEGSEHAPKQRASTKAKNAVTAPLRVVALIDFHVLTEVEPHALQSGRL